MIVAQSCPTLCDPMDWSPPGLSVRGILQTRILEWVAIAFSNEGWSRDPNPARQTEVLTANHPIGLGGNAHQGGVRTPGDFPGLNLLAQDPL